MDQTRCMCGRPDETLMVFFWCECKWPSGAELTGSMNRRGRCNIQSETFAPPTRTGSRLQRPIRIHLCWDISADTPPVKNCHTRSWRAQSIQYGAIFTAAGLSFFFLPPYLNSATFLFSVILQQKPKVFVWFDHHYKLKKDVKTKWTRKKHGNFHANSKHRVNTQMKFHFHKIARHRGLLERF